VQFWSFGSGRSLRVITFKRAGDLERPLS